MYYIVQYSYKYYHIYSYLRTLRSLSYLSHTKLIEINYFFVLKSHYLT